jgi:hypothetical protein
MSAALRAHHRYYTKNYLKIFAYLVFLKIIVTNSVKIAGLDKKVTDASTKASG